MKIVQAWSALVMSQQGRTNATEQVTTNARSDSPGMDSVLLSLYLYMCGFARLKSSVFPGVKEGLI